MPTPSEIMPRERKGRKRTVVHEVDEVTVNFTMQQVKEALLAMYGQHRIGPEETRIPADATISVSNHSDNYFVYLTWDEEPAKF
jgi:hypothetical protein